VFSLERSKNDTSVVLDLLRACAAQMVRVGHAISFFIAQWRPTTLPLAQNVGVLLFFLLSGFLITHTLIQRSQNPEYGFFDFLIDWFARIYSALVPALIFVVIVDWIVISKVPDVSIPTSRRNRCWQTS
jgi:peptidoglycan/LPS O-acetylase OafA/YrhL